MSWICIDFGTCNTAAAIEIDGAPHVVSFGNQQFFPTVACVLDDGSIEVCQNAEPLRHTNPESFKQEFKLQIAEQIDISSVTYTDIVTEILSFVRGCAEIENNGKPVTKAIITIPAIYTETDKRKAVMAESARKAGFSSIEFLSEPQAAAYHYAHVTSKSNVGLSLIYDLGGGTFDPTLLEISNKVPKILGHEAGVQCGGHYFDRALYNYIAGVAKQNNKPLERRKKLDDYAACRRLKEALSVKETATQLFSNGEKYSISRDTFNGLIRQQVDLTLQACDRLLSTANRKWNDVSQVLLVGGSTAIPLISEMLSKHTISHNATAVKIIRNAKSSRGEYNHRFATCLGGISSKILPPPPPPEKIGVIISEGRRMQLKPGDNTFGRDSSMDFRFNDTSMSRHHFTITVTKGADNHYNYTISTNSHTKSTIINNMEALDLQFAPISRISAELADGFSISAGRTKLIFKKQ